MPSAAFTKAAEESRQLKAKPGNDELLEVSDKFPFHTG
jgi:acyl-CoA-binding protein